MKKTLALILMLCLCFSLCACGDGDSVLQYPEGWDRIAEATATLNRYYACETEEEFRAVMHSSVSNDTLKMVMDSWLSFRETWSMDTVGISEQYVRKIQYIETHKGCDIFLVLDGYVLTDGTKTPDDPLPEIKPNLYSVSVSAVSGHIMALTIENGQYVIANTDGNSWQRYYESIIPCTCDIGVVVIPGDPCKGCNGKGFLVEQPDADGENESSGTCTTCGGNGWVTNENSAEDTSDENPTEDTSNENQLVVSIGVKPCPDCFEMDATGGLAFAVPCPDCECTGLENYSYGECQNCGGKGYTKNG